MRHRRPDAQPASPASRSGGARPADRLDKRDARSDNVARSPQEEPSAGCRCTASGSLSSRESLPRGRLTLAPVAWLAKMLGKPRSRGRARSEMGVGRSLTSPKVHPGAEVRFEPCFPPFAWCLAAAPQPPSAAHPAPGQPPIFHVKSMPDYPLAANETDSSAQTGSPEAYVRQPRSALGPNRLSRAAAPAQLTPPA